jgi:uncharacterized protein YecA (UPF0149 family)
MQASLEARQKQRLALHTLGGYIASVRSNEETIEMGLMDKIAGIFRGSRPKPSADIQRNDPCWCGSGKKYKRCHYDSDQKRPTGKGGGRKPA